MFQHSLALLVRTSAVSALLVACSGTGLPPQQRFSEEEIPAVSTLSGHLYVSDAAGIQRFAIANGIPRTIPDLTYSSVASPIALDSSNHLYATSGLTVMVFQPGSTRLARTLRIVSPGKAGILNEIMILTGIRSLALDSLGHLYAALGIRYCVAGSVGCSGPFFAKAVFIYAANAGGTPTPRLLRVVQCFSATTCFSETRADTGGLALDSRGDLLAASILNSNKIYAIASPLTQPATVRTISGTGVLNPNGLAIDTSGELYVDNPNATGSFVAAYPVTANGSPVPNRKISISGAKAFGRGIATGGGRLFVPDASGFVYEVSALAGGTQKPIFRLPAQSPVDVTLGP